MKMFYAYVLKSLKDKKIYIGYTEDISERLSRHNNGMVPSTRSRTPFELIYYEAYKNESIARNQELFYKTGQGRRVLKNRIEKML